MSTATTATSPSRPAVRATKFCSQKLHPNGSTVYHTTYHIQSLQNAIENTILASSGIPNELSLRPSPHTPFPIAAKSINATSPELKVFAAEVNTGVAIADSWAEDVLI
jgi:hypothetical protein